jgi:hypothetical protein
MNQPCSPNYKTNQNLDRLNKISQRLNNIHLTIENEKNFQNEDLETRLQNLEDKINETNDITFKSFTQTKEQLSNLIKLIEEEKQQFEIQYENRMKFISNLENKIMQKFNNENLERQNMEQRLYNQIDDRFNILKNELAKEERNRNESIENFKFYLETEVPKIVEQMKNEQSDREEGDNTLNKMIDDEFMKLNSLVSSEKQAREETEEAFLDMLRSIINKIKSELENEKKQREATEENLLTLLEETCNKLDLACGISK